MAKHCTCSKMKKPWVVASAHLKNRDYFGCLNLLAHLENRDYDCSLIGSHVLHRSLEINRDWVVRERPDIIIVPKAVDAPILRKCIEPVKDEYDPVIIVIPTEFGFWIANPKPRDVSGSDKIILVSKEERDEVFPRLYSGYSPSILEVAGNPRFDIYSEKFGPLRKCREQLLAELDLLNVDQSKIITSGSRYFKADLHENYNDPFYHQQLNGKNSIWSRESESSFRSFIKYLFDMRKESIELILDLSKAKPDHTFIYKVHPLEGIEYYRKELAGRKNIRVINNYLISDILQLSCLHIHHLCTTAVEAIAMGIPTVNYTPTYLKEFENKAKRDLKMGSFETEDSEQILSLIEKLKRSELNLTDVMKANGNKLISKELGERVGSSGAECARLIDEYFESSVMRCRKIPYLDANTNESQIKQRIASLDNFHNNGKVSFFSANRQGKSIIIRNELKKVFQVLSKDERYRPYNYDFRFKNYRKDLNEMKTKLFK